MPRHVGLTLLVSATLVVPGSAVASGGHGREFRVTPDNRPGSYQRLDGTRDALHDACAQPSPPAGRPVDRGQPAQPARDRRGRHGRLHRVPQPGPRAAAAARARALPQHRRRPDVGREPVPRLRRLGHRADVRARLHDACPAVAGVRPPGAPVRTPRRCPVFSGLGTLDFQVAVATFDRDGSRFVQAVRADPTPPPEQERVRSTDQVTLAVDTTHSRHAGNVYVAYVECAGSAPRGPCANENESVIHVVRSTDHGRTFSPPAVIVGPEGRFTSVPDLAVGPDGTVHVTFRTLPDRRAAADLDRALDRRRRHVLARATGRPVHDVRLRPVRAHAQRALQCGDGPFACPSGFTFPPFASFAQVTADWSGVHVIWNQELASGQSKLFVRNSPDGVTWPAPPVQIDGVPKGTSGGPTSRPRAASSRRCSSTHAATRPTRPTGRRATRPRGRTPGRRCTYIARSRDGGRTWKQRRISRQPSTPNYETYLEARLPWYGNRISVSGVRRRRPRRLDRLARRGGRRRRAARQPRERLRRPCPVRVGPEHRRGTARRLPGARTFGPVPRPGRARPQHLRRVGRTTRLVKTLYGRCCSQTSRRAPSKRPAAPCTRWSAATARRCCSCTGSRRPT